MHNTMKRRKGEVRPHIAFDPTTRTSYNVLGQNRLSCPVELIPSDYQKTTVIHAWNRSFFETSNGLMQIPLSEWYEGRPLKSAIRCAERISLVAFGETTDGCVECLAKGDHLAALAAFHLSAINGRKNLLHVEVLWDHFLPWLMKLQHHKTRGVAINGFAQEGEFEIVP